jgi:hypothetical protein
MKRINKFIAFFAILTVSFAGCDYVSEPFDDNGGGGPIDSSDVVMRNVLIEDFTGQRCNNCPRATDEIKVIKGLPGFEGRIVSIAIHTGFFAAPVAPPFDADFRTTEGEAMNSFFKPAGYPTGMVNRIDFPSGHFKSYTSWPEESAAFIDIEADLSIDISTSYNNTNREVSITVDSEVFKDMVGDYNIVALLAEDSIVSPQVTPTGNEPNYIHNYVLRKSSNSIWGEGYISGSVAIGEELNYTTTVTVDNEWREDHCRIIVFVYETTTQEIIQVDEIELFE